MRTPPITPEGLYSLPARDRLLIALCCSAADDPDPVCAWARELVGLHRMCTESPGMAAQCAGRRIELITAINDVAATVEPSLAVARPRSIGALIDRMAAAAEQAMRQLAVSGARSVQMHEAWTRLAELEIEYSDLIHHIGQWSGDTCSPTSGVSESGCAAAPPGLRRKEVV